MAISIIKETIEIDNVTTDNEGNAFLTKRINLKEGFRHRLVQVDMFNDVLSSEQFFVETVISPYPSIPTNMEYSSFVPLTRRFPSGGDDSVLFKEKRNISVNLNDVDLATQFPSPEIAAMNATEFYTDHVFINMHFMTTTPDVVITNIAFSFLLVLDDSKVPILTHTLGVLAESHDAMCALTMSNGRMVSIADLRGNVFPTWRFGGIRPEHTLPAGGANSFFLDIDTRDGEQMVPTTAVRQVIQDARKMSAYDAAFGDRRPDWLTMGLNQGLIAGPVRPDAVPLKFADNGNTLMF